MLNVAYSFSQQSETDKIYAEFLYDKAFESIECIIEDSCSGGFKDAVFIVENTYYGGELDQSYFNAHIDYLTTLVQSVIAADNLIYNGEDREAMKKNAALFQVICDTLPIHDGDSIYTHLPFRYNFDDIWGHSDWTQMFVSKLLATRQGNCHSLPYLYKILADEIDANAHLAVSPNHFYIKQHSKENGWYNTELTSGQFPIDAWLMASGYIHLDAIVNKFYMEALDDKKAIALCLIDLAKGYQKKFGFRDGAFVLKCLDLSDKYYPNYINAKILRTEIMQEQLFAIVKENYAEYPSQVFHIPEAKQLFDDLQLLVGEIHTMGYRKMPESMYLEWLASLTKEKEKYSNKKLTNFKRTN